MAISFDEFLKRVRGSCVEHSSSSEIVRALAPVMQDLLAGKRDFLRPEHFIGADDGYSRNAVYICPENTMSLFSMVWRPGQWTPVHDHGTWGVVGVVKGALHEHAYHRGDNRECEDRGIDLVSGGYVIVGEGSVSTFVPSPDHIHRAGVPEGRTETVTLHLYGRNMNNFNIYDVEAGTRSPFETKCSEAGLLNSGEHAHQTS